MKNKNKKKVWVVVFIIFILIILSAIYFSKNDNNSNEVVIVNGQVVKDITSGGGVINSIKDILSNSNSNSMIKVKYYDENKNEIITGEQSFIGGNIVSFLKFDIGVENDGNVDLDDITISSIYPIAFDNSIIKNSKQLVAGEYSVLWSSDFIETSQFESNVQPTKFFINISARDTFHNSYIYRSSYIDIYILKEEGYLKISNVKYLNENNELAHNEQSGETIKVMFDLQNIALDDDVSWEALDESNNILATKSYLDSEDLTSLFSEEFTFSMPNKPIEVFIKTYHDEKGIKTQDDAFNFKIWDPRVKYNYISSTHYSSHYFNGSNNVFACDDTPLESFEYSITHCVTGAGDYCNIWTSGREILLIINDPNCIGGRYIFVYDSNKIGDCCKRISDKYACDTAHLRGTKTISSIPTGSPYEVLC